MSGMTQAPGSSAAAGPASAAAAPGAGAADAAGTAAAAAADGGAAGPSGAAQPDIFMFDDDELPLRAYSELRTDLNWGSFNQLFSPPTSEELHLLKIMGNAALGASPPTTGDAEALRLLDEPGMQD
eukprot:357924-Chlamydomonas_euryale.AAC.8